MIDGAAVIGSVSVFWSDPPLASVTFTVTLVGVDAVGVPVSTPPALRLMPATVPTKLGQDPVARFALTLSLKKRA